MTKTPKPSLTLARLEAMNAGPRPRLAVAVIKAVVAVPAAVRKPKPIAEGQASLL